MCKHTCFAEAALSDKRKREEEEGYQVNANLIRKAHRGIHAGADKSHSLGFLEIRLCRHMKISQSNTVDLGQGTASATVCLDGRREVGARSELRGTPFLCPRQ